MVDIARGTWRDLWRVLIHSCSGEAPEFSAPDCKSLAEVAAYLHLCNAPACADAAGSLQELAVGLQSDARCALQSLDSL